MHATFIVSETVISLTIMCALVVSIIAQYLNNPNNNQIAVEELNIFMLNNVTSIHL